jgi:transposase
MVDKALVGMSKSFEELYSSVGRPSIPPERLVRALLVQILFSIRSERLLMEQLDYNLLFRWFVGLGIDDPVWVPTVFTKNRERMMAGQVAKTFFEQILEQARAGRLLSEEHFTVDGTLIEAWAGQKSFRPKGASNEEPPADPGNPTVNFHGEKRTNATHESTTDPEAKLYRKGRGKEAKLCFLGHALMENRNGLVVDTRLTEATGTAERSAAVEMLEGIAGTHACTVGGDKAYDTKDFVAAARDLKVTPHVAQNNKGRRSAVDKRTTRHPGYAVSQRIRKRIEEVFGWAKTVGQLRKTHFRGADRVGWSFTFVSATYNLVRMRTLLGAT